MQPRDQFNTIVISHGNQFPAVIANISNAVSAFVMCLAPILEPLGQC